MKRKLALIMATVLVLVSVSTRVSGSVFAGKTSDVEAARQVGQSFIAQRTIHFPEWEGALLTGVQTFHDLDGEINAYLFAIENDGKTVGRVVVGSSEYNHDVLEAGAAAVPTIPSSSEVALSVDKELGIAVSAEQVEAPRLVYLGYDSYIAVYGIGDQSVAYDLRYRTAAPASDLKRHVTVPEDYRAQTSGIESTLLFEYVNLPVPIQNMNDDALPDYMQNNNNCGPTSGAMISEYYKYYRGWSGLHGWTLDHNILYNFMGTNSPPTPGGTFPWNVGVGMNYLASACGYWWGTSWHAVYGPWDYDAIKNCINVQQPNMILFESAPYANWHYCAITGYWIDDYGSYLIINNPWGYSDLVNWSANWGDSTLIFFWPS